MQPELINDFVGRLLYAVCKIIVTDINGREHHATGFWYIEKMHGKKVLILISAKHVFKEYSTAKLLLCRSDYNGKPFDQLACEIFLKTDFLDDYLCNDDKEDLCAIVIQIDSVLTTKLVKAPFVLPVSNEIFIDTGKITDYMLMQEMIMIGYPQGIYDDFNNKAVLRRGVTASPVKLNFKGKPEFLLDISCHHGSSGSPVFIADVGTYTNNKDIVIGSRLLFVGVFVGGWEELTNKVTTVKANIDGEAKDIEIKLPNNLGFVVKSDCIKHLMEITKMRLEELGYFHSAI